MFYNTVAGKAAGGICEIARKYSDGRKKTLNTGVVTFINYNKVVPSRISEVTFAHELGHNFGAKVRMISLLFLKINVQHTSLVLSLA